MDKFSQIPQLSFGNKDAGMVGIWTKASILEHRHTQSLYLISKQNPLDRSCMLIGHAHQGSKPSKRLGAVEQGSLVDPRIVCDQSQVLVLENKTNIKSLDWFWCRNIFNFDSTPGLLEFTRNFHNSRYFAFISFHLMIL